MISRLEHASLKAWPALEEAAYDGWVLRAAGGCTGRANSVTVLGRSTEGVTQKILACEVFYRQRGLPPLFRLTSLAEADDLDRHLESAGYCRFNPSSVQHLSLAGREFGTGTLTECVSDCEEEWLSAQHCVSGTEQPAHAALKDILRAIQPPKRLLTLVRDGQPVASGLAVLDAGYVGLFKLVTAPSERAKGYGRQLVAALLRWAQENGAAHAYLQVAAENAPALALYQKSGFTELYPYWYRVKDE